MLLRGLNPKRRGFASLHLITLVGKQEPQMDQKIRDRMIRLNDDFGIRLTVSFAHKSDGIPFESGFRHEMIVV
jgi:hypothetical protein